MTKLCERVDFRQITKTRDGTPCRVFERVRTWGFTEYPTVGWTGVIWSEKVRKWLPARWSDDGIHGGVAPHYDLQAPLSNPTESEELAKCITDLQYEIDSLKEYNRGLEKKLKNLYVSRSKVNSVIRELRKRAAAKTTVSDIESFRIQMPTAFGDLYGRECGVLFRGNVIEMSQQTGQMTIRLVEEVQEEDDELKVVYPK